MTGDLSQWHLKVTYLSMPMTCVAFGCNNHFAKGCGKQFFRFPMKDPERLSKWIIAIRRKNWKPSASSRICSDHFTDTDYLLRPGTMFPRLRIDAVPSVFEGFPTYLKERLEEEKKVKDGSVDKRHVRTCVAYGCNNLFVKECGKRFFRFPMKNPERLSKWVQAVQRTDWKPSTSSRICSDHFKDKDYILRPGTLVPRLRLHAVPSVIKAKKRIKIKTLKWEDTGQALEHCTSMEILGGDQGTDIVVDHTYSAVHNEVDTCRFNPDTFKLKRKVKTLQRQIQRQRHTIKKLSDRITQLKNIIELCPVSTVVVQ
ncbi:THAP domain-containing protein 1 B-like isoform X4 [Mixophyes fleayi]|uniref:THAP domain-containing protein 1 B-like isoform X4 n=1 Tax=Mixophyes fleayi TaxID=3061075 RepID=UPI003F4DD37F